MDYRDQQLHDFEEHGTRCDVIRSVDDQFDVIFREDSFDQFMAKREPVTSLFDDAPVVDDLTAKEIALDNCIGVTDKEAGKPIGGSATYDLIAECASKGVEK